ncbi:hypothetical protein RvY_09907 [Ramazzottius varieornatus]|uniref:Uncharacterized protein n=1 Tax=Ramazzottius varieornatus TaxID=947166 RepID=A0A1D1VAY7_RAMVA|nr:hypothetical protein RvY_09907 [Ramazzottius varieornatus]
MSIFFFDAVIAQSATTLIPPENLLELLAINSAIHAVKQSRTTTTTEIPPSTVRPGVLSGVPIPTLWPVLPESSSQSWNSNKKQLQPTTTASSLLGYQPYVEDYAMYHNNIVISPSRLQVQPFRYYVANSGPAPGRQLYDVVQQPQQSSLPQAGLGQATLHANGQRQELFTYSPYSINIGSIGQTQPSLLQYLISSANSNAQPGSVSTNEVPQGTSYFLPQVSAQNPPRSSTGLGGQQVQQINNQVPSGLAQTLSQANIYSLVPPETYSSQPGTGGNSVSNSRWNENLGPVSNPDEGKSGIYGYGGQPGYAAIPYNFYVSKDISNNIQNFVDSSNLPYPGCHK